MSQRNLLENERVAAFAEAAQQYCILIESRERIPKREFLKECAVALAQLFGTAVGLLDVSVESSEPYDLEQISQDEWKTIFDSLSEMLGKDDRYWMVFDPYEEEAPIGSSLGDDLSDVYCDIKPALRVYGRTERDTRDAAGDWRFNFLNHWGHHCASASQAIYQLLRQFDDED